MHAGSAGSASLAASHLSCFAGGRAERMNCHDSEENEGFSGGMQGEWRGEIFRPGLAGMEGRGLGHMSFQVRG